MKKNRGNGIHLLLRAPAGSRSNYAYRVLKTANAFYGYDDYISGFERKIIGRHDTCTGQQNGAVRKIQRPTQIFD